MIWLLLLASFTCTIQGQKEPIIISDTKYTSGFPEHFYVLSVATNSGTDFKFYWEHNENLIDSDYKLPFSGEASKKLNPVKDSADHKSYQGIYQFFMKTPAGTIAGHKLKVEFTYVGEFPPKKLSDVSDVRNVVVGQAAVIKCPPHTAGNNFIYKWGKTAGGSGTKFINAGDNYIVLDNGSLFFSHLRDKDVGYINDFDITCGMEANVGKDNRFTWSRVVKLSNISQNWTKFGPEIVTTLPVKVFTVGETIYMKCAAKGNPLPTYSWKMIDSEGNEKAIVDGRDNIAFAEGDPRILSIVSTKKTHAGKYICTATIGQKSDSVEGELTYQEKPSWTSEDIKTVKPSIFSSHSWQCEATGSPVPKYIWEKNGVQIKNSSNFLIDGGKITFPKLEKRDSGMYECVATNDFGNIYRTARLDVQAMKPTFTENRGMTTLFLNSPGMINCSAKAAPVAENTWTKDGVVIDSKLPLYEIVNNQDLIIKRVSKSDIGNYTCTAKNVYGEDSKIIQVEVVGEIKFIKAPEDLNITRRTNIKLFCEARGEQSIVVHYKWTFKNKELKTDDKVIWALDSHTLLILEAEVKHSGTYECIAFIDKPSYAEKKRSATVIVRGPPEEINTLKVEGGCGGLEAKLTWSVVYETFDPILYFIIEWKTSYETDKWHNYTNTVPADRREKVIKDLSPFVLYSFRVLAVNTIGTSEKRHNTDFSECQTPARAPTKCPTPTGHPGKIDVLTIRWKKMELMDQNGPNFQYLLQYRKRGSIWQNKTLNAVTEKFQIPNAGFYELWDFRIRGVNKAGNGTACSGEANSGQNAPNKIPLNFRHVLTGADYVDLEWNPISLDRGNVDGYKIKYWQKPDRPSNRRRRSNDPYSCDKNNVCIKDIVGGLKSSTRVERLAPVRTYVMLIWGYNSGGAGLNKSIEVVTKEGVPGVPDAVVVVAYAKFVELTWKPPKRPNGVIIGYLATIQNKTYLKTHELQSAKKTSFLFSGLEPQESYVVSVQAETNGGYGTSAKKDVTTLPPAAPGQPRTPLVEGTGKDAVNVTYLEGDRRGFPETFTVKYRVKDRKDALYNHTAPQPLNGEKKRVVVISGLDTSKEYEFATFAQNYFGISKWSEFNSTKPGANVITPAARISPIYKRSWFVAVVVIVCVLLLILIIALLVTRKRGERYPVGKREKKRARILDNAEEGEQDTYPMKPPRNNGNGMNRNGSRSSLPNRDPDRDSLDEYGEDRFGEDAASLIGEYNDDKKPSAVAGPEFV